MQYVLDTGILLRLANRADAQHALVRAAVRGLREQGHSTVTTWQNMAEFWNVSTRPAAARGGLGLTVEETTRRLRILERIAPILPDVPTAFARWKELVARHRVMGVQAHDARLVALMNTQNVSRI